MAENHIASSKRILEPIERVSEILFGLIMVLTFTGSLSAAGGEGVREMLIAALGCNTAWGVIDGVFYLMGCLAERGRNLRARAESAPPPMRTRPGDSLPMPCRRWSRRFSSRRSWTAYATA